MSVKNNPRQIKKMCRKLAQTGHFCQLKFIQSIDQVYDQLALQLCFPEHFGRNLDALYDVLITDVIGPYMIYWPEHESSKEALGEKYPALLQVLQDSADQRSDLILCLA